jgi:hypothetical protein
VIVPHSDEHTPVQGRGLIPSRDVKVLTAFQQHTERLKRLAPDVLSD